MAWNLIILFVISILTLGYYYVRRQFNYWKVRGVPHLKPSFPLGHLSGASSKFSFSEMWVRHYRELKGKGAIGGIFFLTTPTAMAMDLDLLRNIFVKDFQHFSDRGAYVNEKHDPLSANLFNLDGSKWKSVRARLSPTFTSGKMKMMHPTMMVVVNQFRDHLIELAGDKTTEVELKELSAQFTTDVIGSAAFGLDCNTMKNPDSDFRVYGKMVFEATPFLMLKMVFLMNFLKIGKMLGMCLTANAVTKFFMGLLRDTVKYREENNIQRSDFLSLVMQIKNTGRLEGEKEDLGKMSFNEMAAQVFLFFVAGFETSSSTMAFAFYELAVNQDIQERARQEVKEVLERHNGEWSYEAAVEMTYIDQIINETLRKYPIVGTLVRNVTIPYKVPDTDVILEKDSKIIIPVLGIHRDPDIYPEPEKFDPERFTKENIAARHPYAWLPFGQGPRNCIGLRFAMMQTRLGVAMIINKFLLTTSVKTPIPMVFDPKAGFLSPKGGMYLNIKTLGSFS